MILDRSLRLSELTSYFFCGEHGKNLMMLGVGTDLCAPKD